MYNSGDAAEQVVRMSLEGAEVALKITGAAAKNLAAALYTVLKDQKKTKGKARIETMLREKRPLKVYTIKKEDCPEFARQAKGYGILYAPIPVRKEDDTIDILVFQDDAARANRIVEKFKLTVVDTASIKEDIEKSREERGGEPAAPEKAAPQKQKSQKERPKRQWWQVKEEKHRKEAYATLDKIFGEFSEGTGSMEAYLDVQSRFPFHSARNALLIEAKCPHAERIHDEKGWKDMGVTVLEEEKRLPIIILEPGKAYRREDGSVGQNFYAKEVYDISQTTARDEAQPQVSYDDRLLLKGLIASSPVPIRAVEELPQGRGAVYDPEQNAILVKKGMDAPDIFHCVSLEAANVQLAQSHEGYSREAEGYKAYAVSYMLCQRYGVDVKGYDISRLDGVLQGQDPREEVPAALTDMRDTFKEMNGRMARAMGLTRASRQKEQER